MFPVAAVIGGGEMQQSCCSQANGNKICFKKCFLFSVSEHLVLQVLTQRVMTEKAHNNLF